MRKKLLLFMLFIGSMALHAEDYTYLTFETTDGAKVSVSVSSLSITISGTTLTAGDQSFTLSNLSKMYFSSSNETTGIESFTIADWDEITEIYDLKGSKVSKDQMHKGVYVVKSKNGTHKITVR
jgi:hypothetical protein